MTKANATSTFPADVYRRTESRGGQSVANSGTSETKRGRGEKRSVGTVVVAAALAVVEGSPPGQQWSPSEGKRILLLIMNKDMKSISKRRG
ncbi:hypothetical protein TYRP_002543 [Tyrophagus putrescentiae]|nr:hypothetical protein TYRP_002543 [Tyrophagus putrescentiae]